jgi:atypical dual specificity phosphatase
MQRLGIAYGSRRIIDSIDLAIPFRRVIVLMGPAGTGKSSLLRALCVEPSPAMQLFGETKFCNRVLGEGNRPVLVAQRLQDYLSNVHDYLATGLVNGSALTREEKRRQFAAALRRAGLPHLVAMLDRHMEDLTTLDRKCVSLVRALAGDPPLICLDELTAGLDDPSPLFSIIRDERDRRSFLVVTHHQGHAQAIADEVVLLAGGRIVEHSPAAAFFSKPKSEITAHFLKTGGCDLPSPDAPPEHLAPEYRAQEALPAPVRLPRSNGKGPPGFKWLIEGRLGGTRQPGIYGDIERDLAALRDAGATMLVSLTTQPLDAADQIRQAGLRHRWMPIEDMGVPRLDAAVDLCAEMEAEMKNGGTVIYHCIAGHGRTGLMLVAHLICRGMAASQALEHARRRKREWVQSVQQEQFLWDLELHLALRGKHGPGQGA